MSQDRVLIDITRPIHSEMTIYSGNPVVVFEPVQEASDTSSALTRISLGSHTGTHIDAPSHIRAGEAGAGAYPLNALLGPAEIVDVSAVASIITAADLPATTAPRVLLKTSTSSGDIDTFNADFVALDESAAQELVRRKIALVGIDAWSIKKKGVRDRVHEILLEAGIVILEGLWLADVAAGEYELLCLPLKVDLDGAPVRAVLRQP